MPKKPQKTPNEAPFCPRMQGHALSGQYLHEDTAKILTRVRCKQWACPYCARRNKSIWNAHLLDKINNAHPEKRWSFMTVTAHPNAHVSVEMSLKNLQGNQDRFLKRLKRAWGKFEYVRIYEVHKSGKYHAHFIISHYPPDADEKKAWGKRYKEGQGWKPFYKGTSYKTLKHHATKSGMGYMVDISPINGHAGFVVSYITKYMTKSLLGEVDYPKGFRRIQCSIGLGAPKKASDSDWDMVQTITKYHLQHPIFSVYRRRAITTQDLNIHGFYSEYPDWVEDETEND